MTAVGVLGVLLVIVTVLTASCIFLPLMLSARVAIQRSVVFHVLFFAVIGFGFMLVEISQVQCLTIFLGHPVYSLFVVLFSLLFFSGAGSLSIRVLKGGADQGRSELVRLLLLVLVLVAFGGIIPAAIRHYEAASMSIRIAISVAILLLIGFFMGMAFPIGMGWALCEALSMALWLWGVNGAVFVCASVLVVVIAIGVGISAAFWTGIVCYAVALVVLRWRARPAGSVF